MAKKGAAQYERDLIEAQQLAEEQIEDDYLGGFQSRTQQAVDSLEEGVW